jgi:hypothetical protein
VLYTIAVAAAIWIVVPAVAYSMGWTTLRSRAVRDRAAVEPKGADPDYERRYRQFEALGFQPVGTSRETCWFINNHKWYWKSRGTRWMTMPDGKMLVSFHRMLGDEPVRFGVVTVFERGGLVRTTCPGAGATHDSDTYLRVEFPSIEPEDLIAKHKEHVEAFSRRRGRAVAAASFEEAVAEDTAQDRKLISAQPRRGIGRPLLFVALPALVASRIPLLGSVWHRTAIGVCAGAVLAAVSHFIMDPLRRRKRLSQSRVVAVVARRAAPGNLDRDMSARFNFARDLLRDQRYHDATEHFAWLWKNMERVNPAMHGVRLSYMVEEVRKLVIAHPDARRRFEQMRAEAATAADANPGLHAPRLDWVMINQMLADDDSTLAWFDAVKHDPLAQLVFEAVDNPLIEVLKRRGRLADICRIYPDPMARLDYLNQVRGAGDLPMMKARLGTEAFEKVQQAMASNFRAAAVDLVAALRAADRHSDADAVQAKALAFDPSDEMKRALGQ